MSDFYSYMGRRGGWQKVFLAAVALSFVPLASAQKGSESQPSGPGRDSSRLVQARAQWFYRQRAYPLPRIPAFARLHALEQLRQMTGQPKATSVLPPSTSTVAPVPDPALLWMSIGPQPTNSPFFTPFTSGRVTALGVDPRDATGMTAYLGAAEGGVWKTLNGGATWAPLTDSQPSLAVGSLAIDPSTNPSTIYVGTGEENFSGDSYYGAGVLKSTDGGMSWSRDNTFFNPSQPLDAGRAGPMIGAIAVQPHVTAPTNPVLLAAVRGSGSTLQSGVWRSTDGGMTWTHALPTPIRIVATDVVFDPNDMTGKTVYAALGNVDGSGSCNGVYKSTDAGMTWGAASACGGAELIPSSMASQSSMGRIALGIGPPVSGQTAGELFAAIGAALTSSNPSDGLLGVFKSVDGGKTWTQLSAALVSSSQGFCNDQCSYDLVIRVSPSNPNLVFAGGAARNATLIRSTDGGSTWTEMSNNRTQTGICSNCLHVDMHALAFSANAGVLYAGNDGGVWSTTNPTATPIVWGNLNLPLAITEFYPGVSAHPSNPAFRSFGGTQDNGVQRYSGSLAWDDAEVAVCDGGYSAIDLLTPSTVYATCEFIPGFFFNLAKSLFNGDSSGGPMPTTTFFFAGNGINFFDNGNFIPPLVMDPENPSRLYFGTFRVWQTADGANSWNPISPDLTGGCSGNGIDCISTIAVAPTDPNTILVGTGNAQAGAAVSLTTSGGVAWTNVSTGLPPRFVTRVAVDPQSRSTFYVTFSGFSGFNGDNLGHVFRGLLGPGPSVLWTDISSPLVACPAGSGVLPNIPVNDIIIDPDIAGTLYVASDIGVFQGILQAGGVSGACWQPLGAGLPNVAVVSLELHHASRALLAGTHGRSVWELELGGLAAFHLSTISPASDTAGDPNSLSLTLIGTGFSGSSVARFGGSDLATSFVSSTQLTAPIPSSDLATSRVAQIEVFDSTQMPNTTNALPFTVTSQSPSITSISPTSATAPAASNLLLTVNGANFVQNTSIQLATELFSPFASSCISTTFVSATQLTATIQKSCLQFGGTFFVTANTPLPGGGSSNPNFDPAVCCSLVVTAPPPANDNFASATVVNSASFPATEDTSGATVEATDPSPPCVAGEGAASSGAAKSVWFKFTPGANGTLEADTIGSAYDTILSVWTGAAGSLTNVACNDDIVSGVNRVSQVSNLAVNFGTTYFFLVTDFGENIPAGGVGGGGKLVFNLSSTAPPAGMFSASASAVSPSTVAAGASASFTLTLTPQPNSPSGSATLQPCTVSPATSTITCGYSPNTVALDSSPATSMVTIMTVSRSATAPSPFNSPPAWPLRYLPWALLAGLLAALALACRSRQKRLAFGLAFGLMFAALVFQGACGGGGGGGGGTVVRGTPAGTYTITVSSLPPAQNGATAVQLTVN